MANTPDYSWPPMETRKVIGKSPKRLDGPLKSAGKAKYTSDLNFKGMLYAVYLTSPHAHARVTSIDTSAAAAMPGVTVTRTASGMQIPAFKADALLTSRVEADLRWVGVDELMNYQFPEADRPLLDQLRGHRTA